MSFFQNKVNATNYALSGDQQFILLESNYSKVKYLPFIELRTAEWKNLHECVKTVWTGGGVGIHIQYVCVGVGWGVEVYFARTKCNFTMEQSKYKCPLYKNILFKTNTWLQRDFQWYKNWINLWLIMEE